VLPLRQAREAPTPWLPHILSAILQIQRRRIGGVLLSILLPSGSLPGHHGMTADRAAADTGQNPGSLSLLPGLSQLFIPLESHYLRGARNMPRQPTVWAGIHCCLSAKPPICWCATPGRYHEIDRSRFRLPARLLHTPAQIMQSAAHIVILTSLEGCRGRRMPQCGDTIERKKRASLRTLAAAVKAPFAPSSPHSSTHPLLLPS